MERMLVRMCGWYMGMGDRVKYDYVTDTAG